MAILSILLTTIIIIASVLIVLVVLVQRPKQEGLGASFGSSTFDSTLGAGATDFLQKLTSYLGIIFFVSAIALAVVKSREFTKNPAENTVENVKDMDDFMKQMAPPTSTPQISTDGDGINLTPPTGAGAGIQPVVPTPTIGSEPVVPAETGTPAEVVPSAPETPTEIKPDGE